MTKTSAETKTPAKRHAAILDRLARDGFVQVADLCRQFACSEATIRRDLSFLERSGYLQRSHGGAISDGQRELPVSSRLGTMAEAKQQIAHAAAALVHEGQSVGLTGGTTTQQVARELARGGPLTVVTNALNVAMELVRADVRLVVTGGELRERSLELVGPLAEPVAAQINLDVLFAGVDGISSAGGITTHNPLEARTNRVLLERSRRVVVVADHTKIGRVTFAHIAPIENVSDLVTDASADEKLLEALRGSGVNVIRA
jgi:DeoR family transcriptional regulator, aga operon transcriptional repressor